jgi:hypothetical protein
LELVPGQTGAIVTVGVVIASAVAAADVTTAVAITAGPVPVDRPPTAGLAVADHPPTVVEGLQAVVDPVVVVPTVAVVVAGPAAVSITSRSLFVG